MANDVISAGADALGEAVVVERARIGAAFDAQLVDVSVDLVGDDPRRHHLAGEV